MMSADAAPPRRHDDLPPDRMIGRGALHEFYVAAEADAVATTGMVLGLGLALSPHPLLWVRHDLLGREQGTPYPPGLQEFGLDPGRILLVQAREVQAVLQAGLEGARCAALAAVVIELWGEARALDLTASRRLALAAKASGTPVLMARVAMQPCPSAAETRWQVQAAPSRALAANAPGNPAFSLVLLRNRGGVPPAAWDLEWNRDTRLFSDRAAGRRHPASPALHGAVVSLPADRPAGAGFGAQRQAG